MRDLSEVLDAGQVPVLRTDRLVLRPLTEWDGPAMFDLAQDPDLTRFLVWDPHRTVADAHAFISLSQQWVSSGVELAWAMTLAETGSFWGWFHCGLCPRITVLNWVIGLGCLISVTATPLKQPGA